MPKRMHLHDEATITDRLRRWSEEPSAVQASTTPLQSQTDDVDQAAYPSVLPARIVHLVHVLPYLRSTTEIVYDYTIPELTDRTLAILCGERHHDEGPYRGYRFSGQRTGSAKDARDRLRPFEAAQLLSGVYARCLDPMRFESPAAPHITKRDVFEAFARRLWNGRVMGAVDSVATGLKTIRELDQYQQGLGTATARWMQHLARETLQTDRMRVGPHTPVQQRTLHEQLTIIRESVTAVDRFTALTLALS